MKKPFASSEGFFYAHICMPCFKREQRLNYYIGALF